MQTNSRPFFSFNPNKALATLLLALVASGCSLEKRTLMSGFHLEHRGKPMQVHPTLLNDADGVDFAQHIRPGMMHHVERASASLGPLPVKLNPLTPTRLGTSQEIPTAQVAFEPDLNTKRLQSSLEPEEDLTEIKQSAQRKVWTRVALAITSVILGMSWGGGPFVALIAGIFLISALKWRTIARREELLRIQSQKEIKKSERTPRQKFFGVFTWLFAIPISIVLFILFLFRDF